MPTPPPTTDDLICAALRGEQPAWPGGLDPEAGSTVIERSGLHGVQPLLHARMARSDWPRDIVRALRDRSVQCAIWELRHQQVLAQTLAALERIGVRPVLIKGTALAYSLYPDPVLRTRGDTDLIIPIEAKERVHRALTALSYERSVGVSGEFISYQASYNLRANDGSFHTLDLHWKINNSEVLSQLFAYDELRKDAAPLPHLSPQALGTSQVHALLLACMHRATHRQNPYYVGGKPHHEANRLIWLYDLHLLAAKLSGTEWTRFVQLATEKGLRAVCLEGMHRAQACFNTVYPEAVLRALARPGTPEPAAHYLDGSKLRQQWMDICALGSWPHRVRLLNELLFPPAAYMRAKYSHSPSAWLPWLYLVRATGGVAKRLAASRSP